MAEVVSSEEASPISSSLLTVDSLLDLNELPGRKRAYISFITFMSNFVLVNFYGTKKGTAKRKYEDERRTF